MSQFYTRTGDDGFTGVLGEGRLPKHHIRIEAVGAVDEATSSLGLARALAEAEQTGPLLIAVQRDLYQLMAELSATPENAEHFRKVDAGRVDWLESQIAAIGDSVATPKEFILPGDSPAGGAMAIARTVVRRAERRVARLLHEEELENIHLLRYLNRLSSLCFVLELLENYIHGKPAPTLAKDHTSR